jgi:hypothetical protein
LRFAFSEDDQKGFSPQISAMLSDAELLLILKEEILEARVGIEPTHKGFADLSLTTWVPRLGWAYLLLPC